MSLTTPLLLCCALAVVQGLGLISAWLARVTQDATCRGCWQRVFFAFLALTSGSTLVAFAVGSGAVLLSGATLAAMALITCTDLSGSVPAEMP